MTSASTSPSHNSGLPSWYPASSGVQDLGMKSMESLRQPRQSNFCYVKFRLQWWMALSTRFCKLTPRSYLVAQKTLEFKMPQTLIQSRCLIYLFSPHPLVEINHLSQNFPIQPLFIILLSSTSLYGNVSPAERTSLQWVSLTSKPTRLRTEPSMKSPRLKTAMD